MKIVEDSNGHRWPTLSEAFKWYNLYPAGWHYANFRRCGSVTTKGVTFTEIEVEDKVAELAQFPVLQKVDPLWEKISTRYSRKEIEMLASGEGIDKKRIVFPEIKLAGEHHCIAVISDTHVGSVYSPEAWHTVVSDYINNNGVECVLHCGDLVDGMKIGRAGTQIYELSEIGFEAQKAKAVELMSKYHAPIYIISGNHDAYFQEFAGANIVKAVCDEVPNMTYIGNNSADIKVGEAVIRLFHGRDGSSYAVSYRLQKLCEAITGGNKPNILLAGHVHKFCYIFERNIHAISVPCMQKQTKWMEGRKLAAHTGFMILDFDTVDGNICNLSTKLFPFYE